MREGTWRKRRYVDKLPRSARKIVDPAIRPNYWIDPEGNVYCQFDRDVAKGRSLTHSSRSSSAFVSRASNWSLSRCVSMEYKPVKFAPMAVTAVRATAIHVASLMSDPRVCITILSRGAVPLS